MSWLWSSAQFQLDWMVLIFLIMLSLVHSADGALVRTYRCSAKTKPKFTNFLTNVTYMEEKGILNVHLRTFALDEIIDVDPSTNMYTTLHYSISFMDNVLVDRYLRLCDVAKINRSPKYHIPPGLFSYPESALPGSTSTSTRTVVTSISTGSATSSELSVASAMPGRVNITHTTSGHIPAQIQKRYYSIHNKTGTFLGKEDQRTFQPFIPTDAPIPHTVDVVQTVTQFITAMPTIATNVTSDSCPAYKFNELSMNFTDHVGSRSPFGSFEINVAIISADAKHEVIGCSYAYAFVKRNESASAGLTWFFAIILGILLISNFLNLMLSPYQDSHNVYLMPAAMICNAPLLNQMTPLFTDYFHYLQFLLFMVSLNLDYPEFLISLTDTIRWIAFLGTQKTEHVQGDVYQTIFTGGMKTLLNNYGDHSLSKQWMWLLINFLILVASCIGVTNFSLAVTSAVRKIRGSRSPSYSWKMCLFYNLGYVLRCYLNIAIIPILSVGLYVLSSYNSNFYGGPKLPNEFAPWCGATAGILLVLYVGLIAYFSIRYIFSSERRGMLYTKLSVILTWNSFYSSFDVSKVGFTLVDQLEMLIFCMTVGCFQSSGVAQLSIIIVLKTLYLLALVFFKPYYSHTRMNRNKIGTSCAAMVICFLHIPFVSTLDVGEPMQTRFVWAILLLHLLVILLFFLLPTLKNIFLCIKWYREYKKGNKGTNIPDYREDGDLIEIPCYPDNRSVSSYSAFADLETMQSLPPSVLGIPGNSVEANSVRSSSHNNVADSHLTSVAFKLSNGFHRRSVADWMEREGDVYLEKSRERELDPEVHKLWSERQRKLGMANDILAMQQKGDHTSKRKAFKLSWVGSLYDRIRTRFNKCTETTATFEVMRPHPIIIQHRKSKSKTCPTLQNPLSKNAAQTPDTSIEEK